MKDRVPTYPGRIKLVPVSGQENTYDMERADSPIQEGTPLNKNTLLTDETAAELGLGENEATPDKAFKKLQASKAPSYTYGTEDIEAGTASPHPTGTLHFIYEPVQ